MARFACKFGVIKYIPNMIKQEVINIGVLLHNSNDSSIKVRFLDYEPRVKNFLTEIQFAEFRAFKKLFKELLKTQQHSLVNEIFAVQLNDENYLEGFQSILKEPFILSKPEWIFVESINDTMDNLYDNFVLDPDEKKIKQKTLIKQVEERILKGGIDKYIQRDISIKGLPFDLHIEFGAQIDDKLDLLQPIAFQESTRENYKESIFWKNAIEKLQYDESLNSGNFFAIVKPPKNSRNVGFEDLTSILRSIDNTTIIDYNSRELDRLINTIKHHGKVYSN